MNCVKALVVQLPSWLILKSQPGHAVSHFISVTITLHHHAPRLMAVF